MTSEVTQRMCKSKVRYAREEQAISAALRSSKTFGHAMRWYKCPICKGWHTTSKVR